MNACVNSPGFDFEEILTAKCFYDPKDVSSLILLGALQCIQLRNSEKGFRTLKTVLRYDPKNVDARFWLGLYFSRIYPKYDQAEKFLSEALTLDRNRSDCLLMMADINWEKRGSLEQSLLYLKQAIQNSPDWPIPRLEMIYVLMNLGQFEEIEQEIEQLSLLQGQIVKSPENPVEEYYEKAITGRGWTNLAERLASLKNHARPALNFFNIKK